MTKNTAIFALLATAMVAGCSGGDTDKTGSDTEAGCDITIDGTYPADEGTAYYRTSIEVEFSEADSTASLTVTGPSGEVTGSSTWEDEILVFTPDAALEPSASYTVDISYCGGNPSITFDTTEVGSEVTEDLSGNTYNLDLTSGEFVEPPNVGTILGQYLTIDVLVSVSSQSDSEVQMFGAIGVEDSDPVEQDLCTESLAFPDAADFSENPYFQLGPQDTTLSIAGYSATVNDLMISGAFGPDGSYIQGATLSGSADTRDLEDALFPEEDEGYICNLAAGIAVSCSACTDGENFCLSLLVRDIDAEQVSVDLQEITMDDICAAVDAGTCAADDCTEGDTGGM